MFSLPSRGRPHNLRRFLAAYEDTGATHPVWLRLDTDDPALPEYDAIHLPDHWLKTVGPRHPNRCNGAVAEMFAAFPDEPVYGLLADDLIPRTQGWDSKLIEAAGTHKLAFPDDGMNGPNLATHPVIGGDLARAIGWLVLPGVLHSFVDTALYVIAGHCGLLVHLPDVLVEHMHPLARDKQGNPKAANDGIYRYAETYTRDSAVFYKWQGKDLRPVVERVRARFPQAKAAA
jgi:hypothetical protein